MMPSPSALSIGFALLALAAGLLIGVRIAPTLREFRDTMKLDDKWGL